MKNLFIILLIASIFAVNSSKAQTAPVAVNDTFYVDYSDTLRTNKFFRNYIVANDTSKGGGYLKIDTLFYNGQGMIDNVVKTLSSVQSFIYTPPLGFYGVDSITYYLSNYPTNYGYDTATIYIYVKRKDYESIDLNNVKARVEPNALFADRANSITGFEVPKGSGSNTIYAANFWFAGLDANAQLKGYAETYASNPYPPIPYQNYNGNAGPIGATTNFENYSYQWDRVWKVSTTDIQNHVAGTSTTEAIANWPAHGDTTKGQAFNLAPFVDVDFDGVYNPVLGDYPKIKGQQAIYFIRNSDRSANQMQTTNINFEFHGIVYAFDCPEDSAINNTIFIDYTIYNRSTTDLTDCYFGQWVDFDLGNSNDDFVGCDVARGTFYVYNGDINDEDNLGVTGYGSYLPAQGVTFLKGANQNNDGVDNPLTTNVPVAIAQNGIPYAGLGIGFGDAILDNEYYGLSHFMYYNIGSQINGNGDPANTADYYNYLQGKWTNGNSMVWGGDGNSLSTGGVTSSNYMFTNDSDPLFWSTTGVVSNPVIWNETSAGNTPSDRRGIGSIGPFTLLAGESAEIELAFVFGIDYNSPGNNTAGIVVMQERVDSIRSYHANGFTTTPCGGAILSAKEEVKEINNLNIYPNPFANQFLVNYKPSINSRVEVYNLFGGKVLTQQITNHLTLLNLSNQPNGVYFVRVTNGKEVITKKVVKQ